MASGDGTEIYIDYYYYQYKGNIVSQINPLKQTAGGGVLNLSFLNFQLVCYDYGVDGQFPGNRDDEGDARTFPPRPSDIIRHRPHPAGRQLSDPDHPIHVYDSGTVLL